MLKVEKLVQADTRRYNRNRIFNYIYNERALSRQSIAEGLNLSLPTVNQNIKELFDLGYIDYSGNFQSTGGRKPQAIMVPHDIKYAISVNIRAGYIKASLVDIYGEICCCREYNESFSTDSLYADTISVIISEMVEYAGCGNDNILGVGITVPGIVNDDNIIVSAPTLGIRNYDAARFTNKITFNCRVENDAKSFAYAQMWRGKDYNNKICLLVDRGVGGALMSEITHDACKNKMAGEFGHMIIHPHGKQCACGRRGCLEAYTSTAVLSDELSVHLADFFEKLRTDAGYKKVFDEYIDNLALGINNICTIYDAPVIIGGEIAKYLGPYMDTLVEKVKAYDSGFVGVKDIRLSEYGKQEGLIGTALAFVQDFLETV